VGYFAHSEGAKSFVTPAKAGVQKSTARNVSWIPAFVGTTLLVSLPNPMSM
jgi:hypothetical protein